MTRQAIQERINALEARISQERARRDEAISLLLTLDGAMQDCRHWLGVIDSLEQSKG